MTKLRSLLALVWGLAITACHAASYTLADYGFNIDGATTFLTRGNPLPPAVNISGFDPATGLGTISINFTTPGLHYVALFVDHEIDQSLNTFFNESGAAIGSPVPGQSWEIDEPGYQSGNLFTNFLSGSLDNANGAPSGAPNDVAMALGWKITLTSNQTAFIQMTISETVPGTGFYLSQRDSASGRVIYFASVLNLRNGDLIPPVITCPGNFTLEADSGLCSRSNVTYNVTATDNLPGVTVACSPPSGSTFILGTTPVNCIATDANGNTNHCTFNVTIHGAPPVIKCPGNIIVECAPPDGQSVTFTASATSTCSPNPAVTCVPPSGAIFPIGATSVNCSAVDAVGLRSDCSFAVLLVGTNCAGEFSLLKSTCLAGEVHANPLLQPYPCGTCVDVTGVPAQGWAFRRWLGDARGTDQTVRITMTQSKCVEAVFGTQLSVVGGTNGTAWLDPVAPLYPCGSQGRVLARPSAGYYFDHWTNAFTDTLNPLDFTVAKTNAKIAPIFLPLPPGQFALAVETRGNGVVRGQSGRLANRYASGSNVVVRAVPDSGQSFLGWSLDAANISALVTNNPITVLMDANKSLVAKFTDRPWIEIVRCQGELVKGLFRIKVHGKLLETLAIDASQSLDNPASWHEVGRATNILGAIQYEDPYLPNVPQRFYRARLASLECAPARLTVRQQGSQLLIEWPASSCNCTLLEASSLNPLANWSPATVTPQVAGDNYRSAVNPAGGSRFYRLRCNQ